jgi:CRP-like cAMP-binding protein
MTKSAKPSTAVVAGLLQTTDLFGGLSESDHAAIAGRMHARTFEAGQTIFERGEPGREAFLVVSGRVRLSVLTEDGREFAFAHATPGAIFGEIAALDGGPRTANAAAISDTVVMSLSQAALGELIRTMPDVSKAVVAHLCQRLRETDLKLEAIALHSVKVRLARFLLSVAHGDTANQDIDLGLSQGEVAMLIGASRPKVNIAFSSLEQSGAVRRQGDRLAVSLPALRQVAGDEAG